MEHRLNDDRAALLPGADSGPVPHLDDKILTAWNGLMIGAFARAAQILDDASFLDTARRAAVLSKNISSIPPPGNYSAATGRDLRHSRIRHRLRLPHQRPARSLRGRLRLDWLRWARQLQDILDLQFWDEDRGGYFSTTDRDPAILLRMKEDYDGAEPAPTSVAALNLWRFGRIYHNDVMIDHARHAVRAFAARLEAQPYGMPVLLAAASLLDTPPVHLIIHSPAPDHPGLAPLLAEVRRRYLPQLVVIRIADAASRDDFAPRHAVIENLPAIRRNPPPISARISPASCR